MRPKPAVSLVFIAATFISIMDSTVVQVALPTLARTFRTNETAASAVVTSYLVTPLANLQSVFATAGFLGILFLVPLFLQDGLAYSAVHSGLTTFPEAIGGMVGIQFSGRVYNRTGPRLLMISGMVLTVVTIGSMALISTGIVHWLLPVLMLFTGMGIGIAMAPAQTAALSGVSRPETAQATTLYNTQRQSGAAAGVALLATVLGVSHGQYHVAFAVAAGLMVIAALVASRVRDADAAATMTPRPVTANA